MWFARYCGSWGGRYTPWSDRVRGLTRGGRETWDNTPSIREGDHEVSRKEATLQLGGILVWYWFGAGLFIWPLWFAMDFQGTAGKEVTALQTRQQYLGTLAEQKRCGEAPVAATAGWVRAPAPVALTASPLVATPIPAVSSVPTNPLSLEPAAPNSYHPHWTVP